MLDVGQRPWSIEFPPQHRVRRLTWLRTSQFGAVNLKSFPFNSKRVKITSAEGRMAPWSFTSSVIELDSEKTSSSWQGRSWSDAIAAPRSAILLQPSGSEGQRARTMLTRADGLPKHRYQSCINLCPIGSCLLSRRRARPSLIFMHLHLQLGSGSEAVATPRADCVRTA